MKNLNIKKRCALQYYFSRLYGRTDFVDCVHSVSDLRFNLQYSIFNSEVYFALRAGREVKFQDYRRRCHRLRLMGLELLLRQSDLLLHREGRDGRLLERLQHSPCEWWH